MFLYPKKKGTLFLLLAFFSYLQEKLGSQQRYVAKKNMLEKF